MHSCDKMADASGRHAIRASRYHVKQTIGKGSYGEVFLVTHKGDGKQYVMKKIKLTASSAKERQAAEQEASLLSKLKHPNIVSYKESFQDAHCVLHIIMGYCEGRDLASRLQSHRGSLLPETQVVEWFVQIALALQYLHDRNILHRDLKTQNIFLSKNDIVKVGDLGIARVLDGSCDLARTVVGTPYYMSPELFSDQPYNHKSDIWALGCCVYEMATLKHPFTAHNINALMVKIVRGQAPVLPQQFSSDLSDIVKSMLLREARKRPSVHQLLRKEYIRTHIKLFLERTADRRRRKRPVTHPQARGREQREANSSIDAQRKSSRQDKPLWPHPTPPHATPTPPGPPPGDQRKSFISKPPHPTTTPTGLSSARERRRQHRREAGKRGREVLSSRPSSDPLHDSDIIPCNSTPTHSPPLRASREISQEDTDGAVQPQGPAAAESEEQRVESDRGGHGLVCVTSSSSSSSSSLDDNGRSGSGDSGEGEEEEFYSLLDSTLHDECTGSDDMEEAGAAVEEAALHPGRLQERIAALRRECEAGLGKDVVTTALSSLNLLDPETDPDMQLLVPLLGDHNHQIYAAKLRQLWLCEDALADV